MLDEHGVRRIKGARNIVGFGRNFVDLFFREASRFQGVHGPGGTTTGGVQLVSGNGHHGGLFDIPAAFLHLFVELLALTLTDFSGRHHYQRNGIHRFTFGVHELIVHRNHFHVVTARFRGNR